MTLRYPGSARHLRAHPEDLNSGPFSEYEEIEPSVDRGEAQEVLNTRKQELYTLLAILTDATVQRFIERTDETGSLLAVDGQNDGTVIRRHGLNGALDSALKYAVKDVCDSRDPFFDAALDRTERLVEIVRASDSRQYMGAKPLIRSGTLTAADSIGGTVAAVYRLMSSQFPEATNEEILAVARRSVGVVKKVAATHGEVLLGMDDIIHKAAREALPNGLRGLELMVNPAREIYAGFGEALSLKHNPYFPTHVTQNEALGCPALVRFDGEDSAIAKLYDHSMLIAEAFNLFERPHLLWRSRQNGD